MATNQPLSNGVYTSFATPNGIMDPAQIITLQQPYNIPSNPLLRTYTNPLNIPPLSVDRLRHLSENVYTLNPTDHIVRFSKVLLGEAGAGQWRNRALQTRIQGLLNGANFYALDSFYGNIFGLSRNSSENLALSPYTQLGSYDDWSATRVQDASYRNRIERFSKALGLGATPLGMQMIAESILQSPVQILEPYSNIYSYSRSYYDLETNGVGTTPISGGAKYSDITGTYQQVMFGSGGTISSNVNNFKILPSRQITPEEELSIRIVLDMIRPANTTFDILNGTTTVADNPVALRGVFADSSWWQLVESIIPNADYLSLYQLSPTKNSNGYQEVLRPPYAEYQGEVITYNNDVAGVSGGINPNSNGDISTGNVTDMVKFYDGTIKFYPPTDGVASRQAYMAGRVVTDAILQSSPYSTNSTNASHASIQSSTGLSVAHPTKADAQTVYVDGMSLYDFTKSIGSDVISDPLTTRFWSTPQRQPDDATVETMEIQLISDRLVNNFTFDIAHFPQNVEIWVKNSSETDFTKVFSQSLHDSVPAIFPSAPNLTNEHPQHSSNGHWDYHQVSIKPRIVDHIQIRLNRRNVRGIDSPPITLHRTGQYGVNAVQPVQIPYSLGVRNFAVNYSVATQADLPTAPIFTTDALGSSVEWTVRQEPSQNTINGSNHPWRSSPQPSADCVVNFYVDTRDASGQPQAVDKFFIDPLYSGSHISLYYSSDDTANKGTSAEYTPFDPPTSYISGNAITDTTQGISFDPALVSYVDIQNVATQFDPSQPWWLGLAIIPTFGSSGAAGQPVWSTDGGLSITLDSASGMPGYALVTIHTSDANSASFPIQFNAGDNVHIVACYNPEAAKDFSQGLHLFAATNAMPDRFLFASPIGTAHPQVSPVMAENPQQGYYIPSEVSSLYPANIYFGGSPSAPMGSAFTLQNAVLFQSTATQDAIQQFSSDPSTFCRTSSYSTAVGGLSTTNSILRFDPSFITSTNTTGMVGGPGNFYENLEWTPVTRDFLASKGYMHIPPTLAKFFKFEFTSLTAQPIHSLQSINRTVRTHQGISQNLVRMPMINGDSNPGSVSAGTSYMKSLPQTSMNYTDWMLTPATLAPDPNVTPATAALTVYDMSLRSVQAKASWVWQYQEAASDPNAPRFIKTGLHNYTVFNVEHSNQVGYFAGLNSIEAFRSNAFTIEDSVLYDEFFLDDLMIESGSQWNRSPGNLNTVGVYSFPAVATGKDIPSFSSLTGIQFATSQNDAIQLAYDDKFVSGAIRGSYDWTSLNLPHAIGDASCNLNFSTSQVSVSRAGAINPSSTVRSAIVQPDPHAILQENSLPAPSSVSGTFGGIATSLISPTTSDILGEVAVMANATVWAAVRLTVLSPLSAPLSLEIVEYNSGSPIVLASKEFTPTPGIVVEETLGTILPSDLSSEVYAQIVQRADGSTDIWSVDTLSFYDEGLYWEFSNVGNASPVWYRAFDIRNNANGVLTFPSDNANIQWRVTATRRNVHVNGLRLRPVYSQAPVPFPAGVLAGPNMTFFDHQPPIEDDPLFGGWANPVPFAWFNNANYFPTANTGDIPTNNQYVKSYTQNPAESAVTTDSTSAHLNAIVNTVEYAPTTDIAGINRPAAVTEDAVLTAEVTAVKLPNRSAIVEPDPHPIQGE